ncbi:LysR family transcriptional regulator [Novosphingobium sp. YJ-S2-02]|uniref:LysR family transcriptional regulator n=1 Tax=Novosphingobium aureum TaxID=2792964 RepID=A0A931MN39_9SPHN|nr:LysR family transcriptional regulator [Novosphingobium aureum]MBH0114970.1 LysR family transcriptional regulator [Novosphingobium aureum]
MMNPQWITSFVRVVETGSFTRAADALNLTQAAVSQHMARLEAQAGQLVIRRPRALELTPAGHAMLAYAREVEQADLRLRSRLSDGERMEGEISLITPGSVGLMLHPLLLDIQEREPALSIRHRFAPDAEIVQSVLDARFEVGLSTTRPDDARLSLTPFLHEPLELIVPAASEVNAWGDLERLGFIDHPDGMAMAKRLLSLRFPGNPGLSRLPIRGFTNQIALILEPVARGLGFTVMPRYARQAFRNPEQIWVAGKGPPVVDTLWLLHRSEWPLTARMRKVLLNLRTSLQEPMAQ